MERFNSQTLCFEGFVVQIPESLTIWSLVVEKLIQLLLLEYWDLVGHDRGYLKGLKSRVLRLVSRIE